LPAVYSVVFFPAVIKQTHCLKRFLLLIQVLTLLIGFTESDSINPLDVVNIYNGGGVGIGDFNNDGKHDIYLTGNMLHLSFI
jgi:hypothetical protein